MSNDHGTTREISEADQSIPFVQLLNSCGVPAPRVTKSESRVFWWVMKVEEADNVLRDLWVT